MDRFYKEFGRLLRERRRNAGVNQGEVAARVGLSRTSITNIEQGRQPVALHMLYALADAVGAHPSELLPNSDALASQDAELERKLETRKMPESEKEWIRRLVSKTEN